MNKGLIIDLEGTLVSSGTPLNGSIELVKFLNGNNVPYRIITNTVSKTVEQMAENLRNSGFDILDGYIINPITALNKFIQKSNIKTFHFVGSEYLAKMIATSYSDYYISKNEYKMDTSIFVKMYEKLTNEKALIMGKPSTMIYQMALGELKMEPKDVLTIGDDGLTDIDGGRQMGMETILVKTGKYKEGDEGKYKPDRMVNGMNEVINVVQLL